jgi:hypothetical protein
MLRSRKQYSLSAIVVLLIALGLMIPTSLPPAQALGNYNNPGILPPNSHPLGHTYGEWSAKWWQFVFSIPVADNPLLNDDKCAVGQSGKVWFLTGKFCVGGGCPPVLNVTRSCRIPSGTALFFPIANSEVDNLGVDPPLTLEQLREIAKAGQDGVQSMTAEIDGRPVNGLDPAISSPYRVVSPVFDYTIPENNIYDVFGFDFPPQTVEGAVADGAFLMLAPLSVGQHTIRFTASFGGGFGFDVTYFINVVPRGRY